MKITSLARLYSLLLIALTLIGCNTLGVNRDFAKEGIVLGTADRANRTSFPAKAVRSSFEKT